MGLEFEIGESPIEGRRGPPADVDTVGAEGEESDVSMEGGFGGRLCCCER